MSKLDGIIKGFTKIIKKLDNLVEVNERETDGLVDEIVEKNLRMKALTTETIHAKAVRGKIVDLIT